MGPKTDSCGAPIETGNDFAAIMPTVLRPLCKIHSEETTGVS